MHQLWLKFIDNYILEILDFHKCLQGIIINFSYNEYDHGIPDYFNIML